MTMTKVKKILKQRTSLESNLLADILELCKGVDQNGLAVIIRKKIENSQIAIQMDRDLKRRTENPVSNVFDLNFQFPIHALTRLYNSNQRLNDVMNRREVIIKINNGLANIYFGNNELIAKKKETAHRLLVELKNEQIKLESKHTKEYESTSVHADLMATKNLDGFQILNSSRIIKQL